MLAQQNPLESWNFAGNNWENGQIKATEVNLLSSKYNRKQEAGVSFISIKEDQENGMVTLYKDLPETFTLSFWMRIPEGQFPEDVRLFWTMDNSMILRFTPNHWLYQTRVKLPDGAIIQDNQIIKLDGNSFDSYNYLIDGKWHQVVMQFTPRTGMKSLFIDGNQREDWNKQTRAGNLCGADNCNKNLIFNHLSRTNSLYEGDLGPVSLYNRILSQNQIKSQFESTVGGMNPGLQVTTSSTRDVEVTGAIDPKEFPKAETGIVREAKIQLENFPYPRYFPGHQLRPNINLINPIFMAGYRVTDRNLTDAISVMVPMVEDLWVNWNYTLTLVSNYSYKLPSGNQAEYILSLIDLANKHPELPVAMVTAWAQIKPNLMGGTFIGPNIMQRTLKPEYYLQNGTRRYIAHDGAIKPLPQIYRPTAPDALWKEDGEYQQEGLEEIMDRLRRPINIVTENGEVTPWPMDESVLSKDQVVLHDYQNSGYDSWQQYFSAVKTNMRSTYRDAFMDHPKLRGAEFTWYAIDGGPYNLDRFNWNIAKKALKPVNGQYYSTPNFYVRTPDNWAKWKGPWRGWEWISITRKVEIADGDKLFSPFVAAGWAQDPEINVRPTQWLGLLKCLSVVGAEYYQVGIFNEKGVQYFPFPDNYIWQAAIPAYAQAITSRYEEILREGNLLVNAEGQAITEYDCGDPRVLFTARKHDDTNEYIFSTTLQPNSNIRGNVPDETIVNVTVDGMEMKVKVRRQGSVYYLDMRNPNRPVITQLDSWHETGHPDWWTRNFHFEAEVPDYLQDCRVLSDIPTPGDYTDFRSYISPDGPDACTKYHFNPREVGNYTLDVVAKSTTVQGKIQVMLDEVVIGEITVSRGNNWQTFTLNNRALRGIDTTNHVLSLHMTGNTLQVDKVTLTRN